MRTVMVDIKPNHPAAPYLGKIAAGSRAVRNTANFLIRNTMTGSSSTPTSTGQGTSCGKLIPMPLTEWIWNIFAALFLLLQENRSCIKSIRHQ